jgi:hypothetical protein
MVFIKQLVWVKALNFSFVTMKVYQINNQQIFFIETIEEDEKELAAYEKICSQLLSVYYCADAGYCEAADVHKNRISSKPRYTTPLLKKATLPVFQFLIFKN